MDKHICKQCGKKFNYCRSCVLKPIPWRAAGFCSRECSAEYKAAQTLKEVVPVEDVEVVITDEDTSTPKEEVVEYPQFFTVVEDVAPTEKIETAISKKKKNKKIDDSTKENDINENQSIDGQDI